MLKFYYINASKSSTDTDKFEMHTDECPKLPGFGHRLCIGVYYTCIAATEKAEELGFGKVIACADCCPIE